MNTQAVQHTANVRRDGTEELIGTSSVIADLSQEIDRIARSDTKVLITGESGVGKELVANAIHQRSPRARRTLVAVNCAGLPETLLESELFGHVKGSFTGAYRDKQGKLEIADGGSIFLDEIGEMTLRMQGLLLRFMETGELQKVGADRVAGRVNVRVIAATNRNLREMISEGTFREDLFYRLNVIHLVVPPLRERRRTVADELYKKLVDERQSFWTAVYPLYMDRLITKDNVRDLVRKGLEEARGNYKIVARMFNMEQRDYKRFLNFLRKHDCQIPFKEYR